MPGTRCCVSVCANSLEKTRHLDTGISYHRFPKDKAIRKLWIESCNRIGKWNPNTCHICSVHFNAQDVQRDYQAELLKIPYRRKLRSNAVPMLILDDTTVGYADAKILPLHQNCERLIDECETQDVVRKTDPLNFGDSRLMNKSKNNDPVAKSMIYNISDFVEEVSLVKGEVRLRQRRIKILEHQIQILESRLRRAIGRISVSLKLARRYSPCKRRKSNKERVSWYSLSVKRFNHSKNRSAVNR